MAVSRRAFVRTLGVSGATALTLPAWISARGMEAANAEPLDAAWRALPTPCEKLARAEARSLGPIAAALQDLAQATGVARVTGTANASGLVKYDTMSPDEATATLLTREACGLSIFGM